MFVRKFLIPTKQRNISINRQSNLNRTFRMFSGTYYTRLHIFCFWVGQGNWDQVSCCNICIIDLNVLSIQVMFSRCVMVTHFMGKIPQKKKL